MSIIQFVLFDSILTSLSYVASSRVPVLDNKDR